MNESDSMNSSYKLKLKHTNPRLQGKSSRQLPQDMSTYLLEDYSFLNQYQLLQSPINSEKQFLARIKSTQQLVKFIKRPFISTNTPQGSLMYKRFQTMISLFQKGIILADNMFILEEGHKQYFYYVIEPYLATTQSESPFLTLQQFLLENRLTFGGFNERKALFVKCKNLLDHLSIHGQQYCGLNSRKIVIDDEGNAFLLPFSLTTTLVNKPYERSYYPTEVLKLLHTNNQKQQNKTLQKWDMWSFGCITVEIFLYLTPYFLSTSLQRQLSKITKQTPNIFKDFQKQFIQNSSLVHENAQSQRSISGEMVSQEEEKRKVINFLINVFNSDQNKRSTSFQSTDQSQDLINKRTSRMKSSVNRLIERTKSRVIEKYASRTQRSEGLPLDLVLSQRINFSRINEEFRELNICHTDNKNCQSPIEERQTFQLKLKSLLIENFPLNAQTELQIKALVTFANGEKFQFFVEFSNSEQGQTEVIINKKITFSNKPARFIQGLLEDDIEVTLQFPNLIKQDQIITTFINLSALTIKNEKGARMWKKPIKGSYATEKDGSVSCKLKLQANIIISNISAENEVEERISRKNIKKEAVNTQSLDYFSQKELLKAEQSRIKQDESAFNQERMTSRFQRTQQQTENDLQFQLRSQKQIDLSKKSSLNPSRKSSISKFSSINTQLDQISNYWKQKISSQNQSQESPKMQISQIYSQRQNVLKQLPLQPNQLIAQRAKQPSQKNPLMKVKKLLNQNKNQKITHNGDLSKKLKRLLIS